MPRVLGPGRLILATVVIGVLAGLGAFGFGFHALAPEAVPQPELFVLLGMIVMFGAIIKGYWSGLMMMADMSWKLHDESGFWLPLHERAMSWGVVEPPFRPPVPPS